MLSVVVSRHDATHTDRLRGRWIACRWHRDNGRGESAVSSMKDDGYEHSRSIVDAAPQKPPEMPSTSPGFFLVARST